MQSRRYPRLSILHHANRYIDTKAELVGTRHAACLGLTKPGVNVQPLADKHCTRQVDQCTSRDDGFTREEIPVRGSLGNEIDVGKCYE